MKSAGIDIGSTTIKCVLLDENGEIIYKRYERHEARQGEKLLKFLKDIESIAGKDFNLFMTGSGATSFSKVLGVQFIQEVNAVTRAVEKLIPETRSVVELGGQDAKMIFWFDVNGRRRKLTTMNDKCAGGTGATIDRILSKLKISPDVAASVSYDHSKVYPVAAKCGVFAETDITGLQKSGVPAEELLISLFDAIVLQNLSVLTRGYTLYPKVLLLGGPHTFFPVLRQAWKFHLERIWKEKGISFSEESIVVPEDAQFFASIGAALSGEREESPYRGSEKLEEFLKVGRDGLKKEMGIPGLVKDNEELERFLEKYGNLSVPVRELKKGERIPCYIGIDGGSTSTKIVVIDDEKRIVDKAYTLSCGNPLEDVKRLLMQIYQSARSKGVLLDVKGVGVTGYAKDMIKELIGADVAVVETVAHTISALSFFDKVDVIVDVGGQDIKVMFMSNNQVKDFKLNTQCSAGNGYFLQTTAEKFGYKVEEYADVAFKARYVPEFNFGCAVFLEQDIVDFQRLGWEPHEIMAGLAKVLPKNIWLYVVKEPNLKKFGKRFLLQGGTQRNLAAVKAQYDFIKEKVPDAEIFVHPITGEAGAFGAAVEAMKTEKTVFPGFEFIEGMKFEIINDETTRCNFCPNRCLRTFIKVKNGDKLYVIAPCEKGMVVDKDSLKEHINALKDIKDRFPDMTKVSAKMVFGNFEVDEVSDKLKGIVVGIPKVLNFYSLAPFFLGYFKSLGANVIYSPFTTENMVKRDMIGGAIDPCFPSKVALAHVVNLLRKKPDLIFFPKILTLMRFLKDSEDSKACPTVSGTPMVVKAVLTKEEDIFKQKGIKFISPVLHFHDRDFLEFELFDTFGKLFGITKKENREAINVGFEVYYRYLSRIRDYGKQILEKAEKDGNVVVLALGRPYHNDPGINHGITTEIQKKGYPILTIDSLPVDEDILSRVFKGRDPFSISDVYKKSYSENTNRKIWGALYAAGHPNIAVLDFSSFRCGPDAPTYRVIEEIMESSGTPYFTFHEIDENRPSGAIKIRVETIDYFLKDYRNKVL